MEEVDWPLPTRCREWAMSQVEPMYPHCKEETPQSVELIMEWAWGQVGCNGVPALSLAMFYLLNLMLPPGSASCRSSPFLAMKITHLMMTMGVTRLRRALGLRSVPRWAQRVLR